MKRALGILFFLLTAFINQSSAQDDFLPPPPGQSRTGSSDTIKPFTDRKKPDLSKFIIEPNFGFGIQQDVINLGLSPLVGYNVWKNLFVGGGFTYYYTRINLTRANSGVTKDGVRIHEHTGGVSAFAQYNIWRGIFARVRVEVLQRRMFSALYYMPLANDYRIEYTRATVPAVLLGAGYNLSISKNFIFPFAVYFNALHNVNRQYSLYPRPFIVQLGFINVF